MLLRTLEAPSRITSVAVLPTSPPRLLYRRSRHSLARCGLGACHPRRSHERAGSERPLRTGRGEDELLAAQHRALAPGHPGAATPSRAAERGAAVARRGMGRLARSRLPEHRRRAHDPRQPGEAVLQEAPSERWAAQHQIPRPEAHGGDTLVESWRAPEGRERNARALRRVVYLRTYAHVTPHMQQAAVDVMDRLFGEASKGVRDEA